MGYARTTCGSERLEEQAFATEHATETTEQAASRVLNATDVARPIQDELTSGADALSARWDELYAGRLSPEAFRELSADTRSFLAAVADGSRVPIPGTNA